MVSCTIISKEQRVSRLGRIKYKRSRKPVSLDGHQINHMNFFIRIYCQHLPALRMVSAVMKAYSIIEGVTFFFRGDKGQGSAGGRDN